MSNYPERAAERAALRALLRPAKSRRQRAKKPGSAIVGFFQTIGLLMLAYGLIRMALG